MKFKSFLAKLILIISLYVFSNKLFGQANEVVKFNTSNGLSINSVNDIIFDKEGFLWAATSDGLQRYDGYTFITYKNTPTNSGTIGLNDCRALFEDAIGNIWVAHNGAVSVKNKFTNQYINFKANNYFQTLFPFAEDINYVWVIGKGRFMLINKKTFAMEYNFEVENNLIPQPLEAIINNSTVKNNNIFSYIKNQSLKPSKETISDYQFYSITKPDYNLIDISKIAFQAKNLKTKETKTEVLARCSSFEFLIHNGGNTYFYNPQTNGIRKHPMLDVIEKNIDFKVITKVLMDKSGNIWFSQSGKGGIVCIKNIQNSFHTFIKSKNEELIYGLEDGPDLKVFVASYRKNINAYNNTGQFIKTFDGKKLYHRKSIPFTFRALKMIDEANLLAISTTGSLFLINVKTSIAEEITNSIPEIKNLVTDLFEVNISKQADNFYVFNYANLLLKLSTNKKQQCQVICQITKGLIITAYCKIEAERWLVGTENGLYYCTEKSQVAVDEIPQLYIKYITKDANGKVWIATKNGIYILQNGKLNKQFTEQNGLLSPFVYGILFDKMNNAWCSSNKGLIRIDNEFNIKTFNKSNGLINDEYNTNGFLNHHNGNFYFAGLNGIDYFNPNTFIEDTATSELKLTNTKVNYENYDLQKVENNIITIKLPYNQNNLSLSFAVMDFNSPESNQFKYYLEGLQTQWSAATSNNEVNYILAPGEYNLLVLGANHNGVWTKAPLTIHIIIVPAWHQTIWFKIALALAALLFLTSLIYFYNKRKFTKKVEKLKMQQQVQFEKERLSRDLHDNLGSQLALLSNNVAHLDTSNKKNSLVTDDIDRLKETSKQLLQTLRETIWILDKEEVKVEDFFDKIIEYTTRYIQSYPAIQLKIEENFMETKILNANNALQLFRICQEAINNACKYSQSEMILLKGISQNNMVQITIADMGRGFDGEKMEMENHYGLKNMHQRAHSIGATLKIVTKITEGTSIEITIKTQNAI